jgi:DNA-binding beta-propeller fold protein YncE
MAYVPRDVLRTTPVNSRQTRGRVIALLVSTGVVVSVGLGGLAAATTSSPMSVSSSCPNPDAPSTTSAIVKTIPVPGGPQVVAVDDDDDTVYVGTQNAPGLVVIDGRSGDDAATVSVTPPVQGVAVNQEDDTVYFTVEGLPSHAGDDTLWVLNGRNTSASLYPITVGNDPVGVAVHQDDDTVYVVNRDDTDTSMFGFVSVIRAATTSVDDTIQVGLKPVGVAVDDDDDTIYVTNTGANSLSMIPGATRADDSLILPQVSPFGLAVNQADDTVYVGYASDTDLSIIRGRAANATYPLTPPAAWTRGIAVDQTDDTVYVATVGSGAGWISVINGRTGQLLDDTIAVGANALGVAVDQWGDNAGMLYVVNSLDLRVIADVTPALTPASGSAGTPVTITVNAPQVSYDIDDTTLALVCFGSTSVALTRDSGDTWTTAAPAGTPGTTVPVTAVFDGGLTARVGSFTHSSAPTPVASPPGPPGDVSAVEGDASAVVSWRTPQDQGSYPVTDYEVTSSPAGGTCLTKAPATTCEITGLTNGVAYSFRARALNGAGWGAASAASAPVTPRAERSLVITGARDAADARYVLVSGTATGMAGETLTPWIRFPGQASYAAGMSRPTVSAENVVTWKRASAKKIYVYFTGESIRSNRVIIPALQRPN